MSLCTTPSLTTHKQKQIKKKSEEQKFPQKILRKNFPKKFTKQIIKKMADDGNIYKLRSWMYSHKDSEGRVTNAFLGGLETFYVPYGLYTDHAGKQ